MTGLGATSADGHEAWLPVWKPREQGFWGSWMDRGQAQLTMSQQLHPYTLPAPPPPLSLTTLPPTRPPQFWGFCCSGAEFFPGGLVSGSPKNSLPLCTLPAFWSQEHKRAPGLPTLQKIQPTPTGTGGRQVSLRAGRGPETRPAFRAAPGIYIAVGSPVGRARHSETDMRNGITSLGAPRAALGCGPMVIR